MPRSWNKKQQQKNTLKDTKNAPKCVWWTIHRNLPEPEPISYVCRRAHTTSKNEHVQMPRRKRSWTKGETDQHGHKKEIQWFWFCTERKSSKESKVPYVECASAQMEHVSNGHTTNAHTNLNHVLVMLKNRPAQFLMLSFFCCCFDSLSLENEFFSHCVFSERSWFEFKWSQPKWSFNNKFFMQIRFSTLVRVLQH